MAAFVTLEQFQARWGSTIPETDEERLNALLDDACGIVETVCGKTFTAETVPQAIIAVVYNAVRRGYDNPSGLESETVGAYTWRGGSYATSGVYLTPEEKRLVVRAAGRKNVESQELRTDLPLTPNTAQYLQTEPEGEPVLYFDEEDLEQE